MQQRGSWQTPRLEPIGTASDLTRGKILNGNDAFCGSPELFCPPKFPPVPEAPPDTSSMDAVVRP